MAGTLSSEEIEELRAAFNVFDKDSSGTISAEELGAILKAQGVELSAQQISDLIKKYDTNGDGDIDFEEFSKLLVESDVAQAARYALAFKSIDTDGNGSVSSAELREALQKRGLGVSDEQLQALIKTADEGGSGELSFEDFLSFMTTQ